MSAILLRPDEIFEAAFFSTDDGPVWVDLSDYIEEGLKVSLRRTTVFDDTSPGTFATSLLNSDGLFNNDRADSPFFGTVNLDVPVRYRARWPNVPDTTRNMLTDVQSDCTSADEFTAGQGIIHSDQSIIPDNGAYWGMYTTFGASNRETLIGRSLSIQHKFYKWNDAFPGTSQDDDLANGRLSLVTWEPWEATGVPLSSSTLADIASGLYDSVISAKAEEIATWGHPLFLRLGHEMNGNWYPWDGSHNPDQYLPADTSDFETSISTWIGTGNASLSRDTTQAHHGSASLSLTSQAAGEMTAAHCSGGSSPTYGLPVSSGDRVAVAGWFKAASVSRSVRVGIEWLDSSQNSLGTSYGTAVTDSTTGWVYAACLSTAPANSYRARLRTSVQATAAVGETHFFDDALMGDSSTGPANYVSAWQHIHDVFTTNGVTNVMWVWCPNSDNSPSVTWNDFTNYYPGDDYVDWVGIDGYNWGTGGSSGWRTFSDIFLAASGVHDTYAGIKPIIVCEFASAESGGDKAAWITDMLAQLKSATGIKAVVWFDAAGSSPEWPIDSSVSAENSYITAGEDTYVNPLINLDYSIVWNTGVLDHTGVSVMTGIGSMRSPDDSPVYVKPNTQYSARVKVRGGASAVDIGFQASLRMCWFDSYGLPLPESTSGAVTLTTDRASISVTGTSPAEAATLRIGVFSETVVSPVTREISFNGGDQQAAFNSDTCVITIPPTAQVGDQAIVWVRVADSNLSVSRPDEFSASANVTDAKSRTRLYFRTITASDIGKRYTWKLSGKTKWEVLLSVYSGVDQSNPIHQHAEATSPNFTTSHTTPNVTTSIDGCWIHSAVFDTASTTTSWSAPVGENIRAIQYTTGGNATTGLCTDDDTAHGIGTYGSKVFTANCSSRYMTAHTLALSPAIGTGPGTVMLEMSEWELVEGELSAWQQGGHWENQFTGLVDSWQESFHGELVLMEVAATDRQKQLATINIKSAAFEDIEDQDPLLHYVLDESDTGTITTQEAANSAAVSQPTLVPTKIGSGAGASGEDPIKWGQGISSGVDGAQALILNPADASNGYALSAVLANPVVNGTEVTLLLWWSSTMTDTSVSHTILKITDATKGQVNRVYLEIKGLPGAGGNIQANAQLASDAASYSATATASGQYFDGATHLLAATFRLAGGQLISTIYIDGDSKATATVATPVSEFPMISIIGVGYAIATTNLCSGTYSHVTAYDYALDSTTIADIHEAGTTAFAGDTADQRIARLCDWRDQPDLVMDSMSTELDRHMPDEQSLLAAIRQASKSEGGTDYINGNGEIRVLSRVTKESATTPLITVPASMVDPSSFAKVTDDTLLVNKPVVTRLGPKVERTVVDTESVAMHGTYEKGFDTILASDVDARNYATYVMAFYSQPRPRCSQVRIDALLLQDWTSIIQLDMWKILRITDLPDTEAETTLDLYIEGWEIEEDNDHWWVTFDTSPVIPFAVLNDPQRNIVGKVVVGW